jgi:hypothetical protein
MEEDYAVIIGLQNYPGLDDPENGVAPLSGSENDALNFKKWVVLDEGGNVPEQNVRVILSSDYPTPDPPPELIDTKPAETQVASAFEKLRDLSTKNMNAGLGPRVGRRLYIFMSGHGIAPTPYGNKVEKEAALLMSNADPTNITAPRYNVPGNYTATWFSENDCFAEIFLFMDCCRDIQIVPSSNIFLPPKGNSDKATRFYAFATNWSRRAREKNINGTMQGVFTKTLLLGLAGASADPDPADPNQGIISVASLKSYLYQNMKEFIDPQFKDDPKIQEPDIDYFPKADEGKNIIISKVPLQKFPVIIHIPAGTIGTLKVLYNGTLLVAESQIDNSPAQLPFNLSRGTYMAMANVNGDAEFTMFDVKGIEEKGSERIVHLKK